MLLLGGAPRAQSGLFFLMGPACSVTCTLGPRLRAQRHPGISESLMGCKATDPQHRARQEQRPRSSPAGAGLPAGAHAQSPGLLRQSPGVLSTTGYPDLRPHAPFQAQL